MANYDADKFKKMWVDAGITVQSIADEFGIARSSVRDRARRLGLPKVTRSNNPPSKYLPREQVTMPHSDTLLTALTTDPSKMVTTVWSGDYHNPYQDPVIVSLFEQFLKDLQPDIEFLNGDLNDMYQLSKFDKNPSRMNELQKDLNVTKDMIKRHRSILPNARMIEIDGNHDDRLRRHLWAKDPAMASLDDMRIGHLLGLDDNEVEQVGYERGLLINNLFIGIHGDLVSVHSGYTAKRMREKHGGSGIHNHTHRGGSHYKTDRTGIYGWWENFCMCDLHPDYVQNPNWQQGFSVIHFKRKRFWVEQVPIIDQEFIYSGKHYKKEGVITV